MSLVISGVVQNQPIDTNRLPMVGLERIAAGPARVQHRVAHSEPQLGAYELVALSREHLPWAAEGSPLTAHRLTAWGSP